MSMLEMDVDVDWKLLPGLLTPDEQSELEHNMVEAATDDILDLWRAKASQGLGSTRDDYLQGLVHERSRRIAGNEGFITLVGAFPNMIEGGSPPFDIKPGILESERAHIGMAGQRYLAVPFRWGTPGALGESFSGVMPKSVYKEARELAPTTSAPGRGVIYGGRTRRTEGRFPPQVRPGYGRWGGYQHKTGIYQGIIRQQKTYEKATQSHYTSFRMVSDRSEANSWIHPGFVARNFAEEALQEFESRLDDFIEYHIAGFLL